MVVARARRGGGCSKRNGYTYWLHTCTADVTLPLPPSVSTGEERGKGEANRPKGNFAGVCRRLLWLGGSLALAFPRFSPASARVYTGLMRRQYY